MSSVYVRMRSDWTNLVTGELPRQHIRQGLLIQAGETCFDFVVRLPYCIFVECVLYFQYLVYLILCMCTRLCLLLLLALQANIFCCVDW